MLPVAERASPCEVKEKCFLFFPSERQCDLGRRADWDIRQSCLLITILLSLLSGNPMVLDAECLLLWVYSGIPWVYNLNSENKNKNKPKKPNGRKTLIVGKTLIVLPVTNDSHQNLEKLLTNQEEKAVCLPSWLALLSPGGEQ